MSAPGFGRNAALGALWLALCPALAWADGFEIIQPAEATLQVHDGEIRARLNPRGCEEGFEGACTPVLQRSEYVATTPQSHGDGVTYGWDIMVPEDMSYGGSGGYLRAVRFMNGQGESILSFLIDRDLGYSVSRIPCFGPEGFGAWHSVEVRAVWDATKRKSLRDKTPGALTVTCDGTEVLDRSGRPNIAEGEEVRLAIGLAGALNLAPGDNTTVLYRNVRIER